MPNFTLLGASCSPLPRNGQNMIWMIYLSENFVEIPGILVQYLHIIRFYLFVCQSASWLTSLLKLGKYRDVSCPGWDIFFKYFGHLPGMFFTLFLKIKILLYVCLSVSWLTSLLKLGQYRDISASKRVILLIFFGDIPWMFLHYFKIILQPAFLEVTKIWPFYGKNRVPTWSLKLSPPES